MLYIIKSLSQLSGKKIKIRLKKKRFVRGSNPQREKYEGSALTIQPIHGFQVVFGINTIFTIYTFHFIHD